MSGPKATVRRAEVASVRPGFVTVRAPAEAGTVRLLEIPCPAHFSPAVDDNVTLVMSGAAPVLLPDVIAADSITAREIIAGAVTALLLQGDTIVAGDPLNAHSIQDAAGWRMYNDEGTLIIEFDSATASALVTGIYKSAVSGERFNIDGNQLRFYGNVSAYYGTITTTTQAGNPRLQIAGADNGIGNYLPPTVDIGQDNIALTKYARPGLGATAFQTSVQLSAATAIMGVGETETPDLIDLAWVETNYGFNRISHGDPAGYVQIDAATVSLETLTGAKRVETNATGVGFNATAPIAKPALNAAATTAGEALTLVNQIRAALIDYGLCT